MTIEQVAREFTDLAASDAAGFDREAEVVLAYQRKANSVYARYCKAIASTDGEGGEMPQFLPVEAFKQADVVTFAVGEAERIFESSRTGRGTPSRHFVRDLRVYERSAAVHFAQVFGRGPFRFASYLPSYEKLGRTSSLLYMVEHLITRFGVEGSGSVLSDPDLIREMAAKSRLDGTPLIVFGAAFGLLDLLEHASFELPDEALVIETGGMKTYRREISRDDLHARLAAGFGVDASSIRSEYGMCELLSQCYTRGGGIFYSPPWMRTWVVDPAAPFKELPDGRAGALAVLDLANLYSASALLTKDRAVRRNGGFEILGRLTGAELRGCNFLLEHV